MSDDLVRRLRDFDPHNMHEWEAVDLAADRIEELERENERLRRTIDAAAKLGRIIGFLSYDEARISAFLEDCGPDLIDRARATLAQIEGEKT